MVCNDCELKLRNIMKEPSLRQHSKDRIVAVDLVRIMAAMLVMYAHLGEYIVEGSFGCINDFLSYFSALFFVLAGYFACRNITWRKAFYNSFWRFAPYMLWVLIALACRICEKYCLHQELFSPDIPWYSYIDCTAIFINDWRFEGVHHPVNVPLWFMRDLIFLFLLSPLLNRCSHWLFPVILLLSLSPQLGDLFSHRQHVAVLSPYSIAFFSVGCWLRRMDKGFQHNLLTYCNGWFLLTYPLLWYVLYRWGHLLPTQSFVYQLYVYWMLYQLARWIELHIPHASRVALTLAPVTFLTFATHFMAWVAVAHLVHPSQSSGWLLLLPVVWFGVLALFFFAMKRWARPLLHLVAHYKLRADDFPTSQQQAFEAPAAVSSATGSVVNS